MFHVKRTVLLSPYKFAIYRTAVTSPLLQEATETDRTVRTEVKLRRYSVSIHRTICSPDSKDTDETEHSNSAGRTISL